MIGSDRAKIDGAIGDTAKADGVMSVPVSMTMAGKQITVSVAASSKSPAAARRSLDLLGLEGGADLRSGAARIAAARSPTTMWCATCSRSATGTAAAGSWTVPLENISREGVDAAVVYVQDGSRDKPGPMLGAAYTSLH